MHVKPACTANLLGLLDTIVDYIYLDGLYIPGVLEITASSAGFSEGIQCVLPRSD